MKSLICAAVFAVACLCGLAPASAQTHTDTAGTIIAGVATGNAPEICVTPTVTASNAYGTNYVVGGLLTFSGVAPPSGNIVLQSASIDIKDTETSGFTLTLFRANPFNTTWTDASAAAINAADKPSVAATIAGLSAQSVLGSSFTNLTQSGIGQPISLGPAVTTLYGVLTSNAALTNNFAGTSDVKVCVGVLQAP